MTNNPSDRQWMSRAIQLANRGRYTARPNPCVACVLVKAGALVGEGWHYQAGEAHAEVNALAASQSSTEGATAYVTLEPCHHQGKTGPCTQALIQSGVSRVVYAMKDPNPLVAGQGLLALKAAGIEVVGPLMETEARALNPGFISRMERHRPWLRCKLASSLDGRTAMANGESQWITASAARSDVQAWRAQSSAIITGIDSILLDNSQLTLRPQELNIPNAEDAISHPPLRVVLDTNLRILLGANILKGDAPTLLIASADAISQHHEKVEQLLSVAKGQLSIQSVGLDRHNKLQLSEVLTLLASHYQCNEVLLEAGATLSGAFLQQGLVDELIIYQAPVLLGSQARPLFDLPLERMADKFSLDIKDSRQIGPDLRIIAHPKMTK